jgi:arylsulfatase A-like enzyme
MNRRNFLKTAGGVAAGAGVTGTAKPARAEATRWTTQAPSLRKNKSNVIVVLFDSLRWDYMGLYGSQWCQTPNLDRFARECMVFDKAYPENLPTLPARTSMWTGRFGYPFRGWQDYETDDNPVSEILWDQGVHTGLITDAYHLHKPRMGYGRGYDYVEWLRGQEGDPFVMWDAPIDLDHYWKPGGYNSEAGKAQTTQYLKNRYHWQGDEDNFICQMMKSSVDWLKRQREKNNIFLWMDCFDPHEAWDPPEKYWRPYDPEWTGRELILPNVGDVDYLTPQELHNIKAHYAGMVTLCDEWFGYFIEEIRQMGYLDNSLIIFLSDHGEPFGEHGYIRKCRSWPYEHTGRIPLLIRHPEGHGAGQRFDGYVHTTDIAPTILDHLGCNGPDGVPMQGYLPGEKSGKRNRPSMQGQSLLPILRGQKQSQYEIGVTAYHHICWSIRSGDYSHYRFVGQEDVQLNNISRIRREAPQVFHTPTDPGEHRDLSLKEPDLLKDMARKLDKFTNWVKAT